MCYRFLFRFPKPTDLYGLLQCFGSKALFVFCNFFFIGISVTFKSREDHRKQIELEEARKAGLALAELDEYGNEINPHIPQYMPSAPWYLNAEKPVSVSTY
ncbi:hypothetical protein VNO80_22975 [Phaseolus coccineus]|uniref:Pre-mRNA-splicing factor SLU7 n=1 Tax=Phaseolus coccineus TaxID=3886 RepID=A0AAN9M661_PHACN